MLLGRKILSLALVKHSRDVGETANLAGCVSFVGSGSAISYLCHVYLQKLSKGGESNDV